MCDMLSFSINYPLVQNCLTIPHPRLNEISTACKQRREENTAAGFQAWCLGAVHCDIEHDQCVPTIVCLRLSVENPKKDQKD